MILYLLAYKYLNNLLIYICNNLCFCFNYNVHFFNHVTDNHNECIVQLYLFDRNLQSYESLIQKLIRSSLPGNIELQRIS